MYNAMKSVFLLLLTGFFIIGCSSVSHLNNPKLNNSLNNELTYQFLESQKWMLVDAKDADGETISALFINPTKPLVLNFVDTNEMHLLALENTCNRFSAAYTVISNDVDIREIASTMMACPEKLADFDAASANIIMGKYSLTQDGSGARVLTINGDAHHASFKAIPKQ